MLVAAVRLLLVCCILGDALSAHVAGVKKRRPFRGVSEPLSCPCLNHSLCAPLAAPLPDAEVFAFQVVATNWPFYDFSRLTTIALYDGLDPGLLCMAHARGVRLVWAVSFSANQLLNDTARSVWLRDIKQQLTNTYTDGVNFDFEDPIDANSPEIAALTSLVKDLRDTVKQTIPYGSITFDVAWSSHHVDVRYYDYPSIALLCDFVVIMDYDTRSQVFEGPPCYAGANSPLNTATTGITSYLLLPGVTPKKLVLGVPWYGYSYHCIRPKSTTTSVCEVKSVPFRGVPCSDAAGSQWGFSDIQNLVRTHGEALYTPVIIVLNGTNSSYATVNVNSSAAAPSTSDTATIPLTKYYWDVPQTLEQKYAVARDMGLRGVSMWAVDYLDYHATDGPAAQDTREMWRALDRFLHHT